MKILKQLLGISFLIVLCCFFTITRANASNIKPQILGQYPVCEPSSVVKVNCAEFGSTCLLVGDNEQKKSLFLYPVNSEKLESTNQKELNLGGEISDIEAIAKLEDNKVVILGSHSRNSKCELKKKRRRFLQAKVLGDRLEPIGDIEKSCPITSELLFDTKDFKDKDILQAVSRAIDEGEIEARIAKNLDGKDEIKTACRKANSFNAEGAVTVFDSLSTPKVWIGLRSPVVPFKSKDYATLMGMKSLIQLPHLTSLKVGIDSPKGVDASVE